MFDEWKRGKNKTVKKELEKEGIQARKRPTIKAKVAYQYPKKREFPFPIIPDAKINKNDEDIPTYIRKRHYPKKKEHHHREENTIEKTSKKPFRPSKVASPIYGFQKRSDRENVQHVPAYKRKEDKDFEESKLINVHIEENVEDEEKQYEPQGEQFNEQTNIDIKKDNKPSEFVQPKEINNEKIIHQEQDDRHKKKSRKQKKREALEKRRKERQLKRNKTEQKNNAVKQDEEEIEHIQPTNSGNTHEDIPLHLLNDPDNSQMTDFYWIKEQKQILENTLKHFNVQAKVVNAVQGPTVTRFEVKPELGVKVSKVKNLSDDLKLNLAAEDIRIEAPIPGKHTIGIEIPNKKKKMVSLQEILKSDGFVQHDSPLSIALGLSIEGNPLITNVQKMPHGLIAGATGSGKSVCINAILLSLIYKTSYEDVKFLLIDPKMVELAPYNGIPHLVSPVITDVKAATMALKWAVQEMEDRYQSFVKEGVRNVEGYNGKMIKENRQDEKMPFLVIVIDELADLMMISPHDVEDAIARIAQKARACGIHLLVATQRPSVDVITGLIKANIPTRIAFSVSSQVDSRTILDTGGAEQLLGKGDMLFIENGSGKSIRLQGPFVDDDEINRVTAYARKLAEPNYLFEAEQLLEQVIVEDEDDLLDEAVYFVINKKRASTSLLQRQFKIGYNRAARMMDTMERNGVISEQNGSKPREILMTETQWEELRTS